MKKPTKPIDTLRERLSEIGHLGSLLILANWDQEVNMPRRGSDARGRSVAELSSLIHGKFVALDHDGLLSRLQRAVDAKGLRGRDAVIVSETWRSYERERKLPDAYVRELAETTSKAQRVWAEARAKDDFALFAPWLERIVALKRREAKYIGYTGSPYDALIDAFEPGMTAHEAERILESLKAFLVPFLRRIMAAKRKMSPSERPNVKKLAGHFPLRDQMALNEMIAREMGFDFDAGRLDQSTHPFTITVHPEDVRITTRYSEADLFYSLGSTIHETGHALYEQGLPAEHFGTPLAEAVSLGIHESQSRLWENQVGRSMPFWKYMYPKVRKAFPKPFKDISLAGFYRSSNEVSPSLIRTQADEVTYNLHIIIRFEIERALIEGRLLVRDLPRVWREKMREYLGVSARTDRESVLQDVHWSGGMIGYFPTYSFGNLYAAQIWAAMERSIPDLAGKISRGQFKPIREWLRKHVHEHGKTYRADALIKRISGEPLDSRYFCDYLSKKYGRIYELE